ncbi:MAG: Unknown protein [uncultured Sulfurovum sp.]|uniref:LysM domain-containing protein n=1 Tax=uncultured Sulfurovum sp. TaxID=269237 RepID=A0A6S6S8R8_9BACT|nr:MAG: Unknown protein [uncultured Sulfurovum sp.]
MEIVKRIEGSEPEEVKYDFEEHYLKEDKENTKRKKSTFLKIMAVILIVILGYLGFKNFKSNESKTTEAQSLVTQVLPVKSETSKTVTTPKVEKIETKESEKLEATVKINKEPKPVEKVAIYTEVLAQELKPEPIVMVKTTPPIIKKEEPMSPTPKMETIVQKELVKIVNQQTVPEINTVVVAPVAKKEPKPKHKMALNRSRTTIVKKGDTLALISKKFYGSEKEFDRIIQANRSIKSHKTNLQVGQKIFIPSLKAPRVKKTTPQKRRIITVKKGDTLNIIAQRYYGNPMGFKRIVRANKNLKNAKSKLKLGEEIVVPYLPKNQRRRFVTVKAGYSLAYISKKFYGNTNEIDRIVKANIDIKNKDSTLRIGQKVYVPK